MDSIKETEALVEAMNIANNIQPYEEGVGDVIHKAGNAIKNFFGTSAGAAQRAKADAQVAQQTRQDNEAAAAMTANPMQTAQSIMKILKNDITKTKVGNVASAAVKGLGNAAKTGAINTLSAISKATGVNEIDSQKAGEAVDNVVNNVKNGVNKISNAAKGQAKTDSEKKNAEKQNKNNTIENSQENSNG